MVLCSRKGYTREVEVGWNDCFVVVSDFVGVLGRGDSAIRKLERHPLNNSLPKLAMLIMPDLTQTQLEQLGLAHLLECLQAGNKRLVACGRLRADEEEPGGRVEGVSRGLNLILNNT